MLRSAGTFTRTSTLFRSINPNIWPAELLERTDRFTLGKVERIAKSPLTEQAIKQALLPISLYGLGLSSATDGINRNRLVNK